MLAEVVGMDVLTVKNLSVSFFRTEGEIEALKNVSFTLREGEILAVMGKTGCGKSVLCKSILKLLPDIAKIKTGHIYIRGEEITGYSEKQMQGLRGRFFSMVFQNPMTALNPCMSVGEQIGEMVRLRRVFREGEEEAGCGADGACGSGSRGRAGKTVPLPAFRGHGAEVCDRHSSGGGTGSSVCG